MSISRRRFTQAALLTAGGLTVGHGRATAAETDRRLRNRLFVMDTWFWRSDFSRAERLALLNDLGVTNLLLSGAGEADAEHLAALDEHGMTLEGLYHVVQIEQDPDAALLEAMERLEGRGTTITLAMRSEEHDPSDPAGDAAALEHAKAYIDAARELGLTVAFYPHAGFWVERVSDGVRLARQVGRSHVGAMFNLYHWLARDAQDVTLERTLREAMPVLKAVTINGARADTAEVAADEGILPLDEGDYDVRPVLRELIDRGYAGPIGLQGYGIEGEVAGKLERSVQRYRGFRDGV